MALALFLLLLAYACGQLQEESMLHHFEADEYVQEGNEWCMWFVPKNARAIRDIKMYKNDSLKLDCAYSPEAPPWIELSFKCLKGCVSIFCAPSDPYGLRIDGHIWHVYVRNASSDLQGTYTLQVDFHGNHRDVHEGRLEITKPPKIRPRDINCSDPHFEDALRSPSAEILEEKHFRKTINKDPLTEGKRIHGVLILSLGVPKGKAGVYIVKLLRNGNESELLTCDSHIVDLNEALGSPNPAKLTFDCLLTVEHVSMLIVVANVLRNDPKKPYTTDSALKAVKTAALNSVTLWLTKTKPEIPEFEGIYGFARRLVQLFVGWPAVVPLGSTARFICSFPDGKVINAKCWRDKHVNELGRSTRIPSPKNHGTYFEATLENAQYNDSGVYTCIASRCDLEQGCITRPICKDRRLYISRPTVSFRTWIGADYNQTHRMFNHSYGARNYADAPEKVYTKETRILLCSVPEEEIVKGGKITLKYTHYDPVTNIPTELEVILNRQEKQSRKEERYPWRPQDAIWVSYVNHYYLLGKTPMPMYAGLHIAECQMTYSPSKEELPDWMRDPNDKNGNRLLRILGSKSVHIEFYQGATGKLQFESKTPYFEEHPVPLGTSVRCKGGTGFPLLKHSWSLINPLKNESYKKYASSLPLPYWKTERVFRDIDNFQPPNMIHGDTVTIPHNFTLRGVSFLFLCEGTNTDFHGKAYTISRFLHLTVCICTDERMKKIDISMIVSPQLLPSVKMEGHSGEMERIDFYGRRYLTLLRQIILGLPQSSELARISIVPTTILGDLKRHPLYRKALDFRHNLTRHQLVEGLISENIHPASLFISETSCPYKYRVRMDEAIQAIPETFSTANSREMRKRPHIILYPMDPWNQIDSPSIAKKILKKLKGEGSELVKVYFLNKSHPVWEENTHELPSSHTVDLMPQAKYGSKECEEAMSDNDEAGFIDRLAMFNKICELAKPARIKDTRTPGFLYFSLPYRMQLLSAKITISCMSRLDPFGAHKRQMRLCLANYDAVRTYEAGKSSVEDLDKTCVKHLLTTDFSKPEDRCISLHYEMVLEDSHNGLFAVCYRRTQDMAKELATFAFRPIRLTSLPLTDPVLVVVHWPMKSGDSAEFQCVMGVSIPPFQVDLVYNPHGTNDFIVVERRLTAFTLGQINQKGSVRLIWREIPPNADEADIYCLISRPGIDATNFRALPNITATIKVSKSERRRFLGGCPREPVIKSLFSRPHSNEAASPKLGNRMHLSCEADTGVENAPIQMAYADKETRFVICNHPTQRDLTGVVKDQLEINLDCWFADWNKGGCFQQPNAMYSKPELVNFTACKIKRKPKYYSSIRTIELEIPLLRIEHFGGFVFCETLPRRFVGKTIPAKRLLSKYLENYFEVEPQILSMEVSLLDWNCLVIANPPAYETSLETIEAYPQSLRRALAETHLRISYNNKSFMWQMSKEAANFFPTDYLKSVNDANSSMLSIVSLYRPPPNPERTTEGGLATVECSVMQKDGDNSRTASRRIHITYPRSSKVSRRPSGTTLIPSSGVVQSGSSWGIRCTLPSNFRITALYAYLLYKADLEVWGFVGVPLVRIKVQTDVELGKRVRVESFRPVGLWMKKPLDDLTVTLLSSGGKHIIEIMIKKAKIAHAGRYYCRFEQFNSYTEAWPDQELYVLRVKQPPILGYRREKSGNWTLRKGVSPFIEHNAILTVRCLSWQPDHKILGYKRQPPYLARFKNPKNLMYRVPNKELKVKDLWPTSRLFFHVVDYKFRADGWKDFNMSIGCFLTFDLQEVREYNMSMNASVGPLMVCVPPRTLLIMPDNRFLFHKEDQLECSPTGHVFPEPTVSWHWVLGPLPESHPRPTEGDWTTFNSSILPLSSLPGPGFYVYKCTVEHTCVKKSTYGPMKHMFIISEPNKTFDIVEVRPVLAVVPEVIHFNCPSILTPTARRTSVHQEVFATSLTWFRTRRQINFTEPYNDTTYEMIVKHDFIHKNVSRPTPQFGDPERIQNFRLENEVRVDFAMDIGPSSGEDYGYYGCITEISDEEKLTNGTRFVQHASQPVCLILKNELPKLDLKVVSNKGVTTRKDCFIAEEIVQVECTTPAYQTFCDDSDKPLGRTLIGSRTYLQFVYATNKLDGISYDKYPKSITLNVTSEITKSTSKPDEIPRVWLEHTKYTFKVSWRHDEAVISCHTVPLLQTYFRESPAANETFRREFERLVPIIKGSTDENMCVYYPPRNILIDPPPPDQTSREEVTFTIDRDIMITCSVDGHPLPKLDIDIYPLRISLLGIALDKGLADPDSWTDLTQAGVDWPNFPGEGNASVIVGESRAPSDVVYVGVCQAESVIFGERFTAQKMFFFRISAVSEDEESRKTTDLLFVAFIVSVLAFIVVTMVREILILLKRSRELGKCVKQRVLDPTAEQDGGPNEVNSVGDEGRLMEIADDNILRNRIVQ